MMDTYILETVQANERVVAANLIAFLSCLNA